MCGRHVSFSENGIDNFRVIRCCTLHISKDFCDECFLIYLELPIPHISILCLDRLALMPHLCLLLTLLFNLGVASQYQRAVTKLRFYNRFHYYSRFLLRNVIR